MVIARRLVVAVAALIIAVQVVRNAAVAALSYAQPESAAAIWSGHPDVEISQGLTAIGRAAREQRPVDDATFALIRDAAVKAPLAAQPFLVRGVQAQTGGDAQTALQAFTAAQWRDPRSLPAAYFLADHYLRANRALEGLNQMALVSRLAVNQNVVAASVAAYAENPSNWDDVRALFRRQKGLQEGVLTILAKDSRNAGAVLALADAEHRRPDSPWLPVLLNSLVESGDYVRARAIWSKIGAANGEKGSSIYDPGFAEPNAPPPFNWSFATSEIGLAERQPGGRLHALFYGNVDGVLAKQLVLLPAGTYRLNMNVVAAPAHPETLLWAIRCDKSTEPLAVAPIADVARQGLRFQVPAGCQAQWLELRGQAGDVAQQADVTLARLKLTREAGNG